MTTFEHILVPTDFGEPAEHALDVAIALASKFNSKITLLHSSWFPPMAYGAYAEGLAWPISDMIDAAQKELDAALVKAKKRYEQIDAVLAVTEPSQTILEIAKDRACDLIVMGTHGRRGLPRILLGSVAEKTVRLSPVPVLTLSGKAGQEAKEAALAESVERKV